MNENERQPLAERSILALCIHNEDAQRKALAEGLTSDHFIENGPIFQAIEELFRQGSRIDPATIAGHVAPGEMQPVDLHDQIDAIAVQTPDPSGWTAWVKILRRAYASRLASDAAMLISGNNSPEEQRSLLDAASEAMRDALCGPSGAIDAKTACEAFVAKMRDIQASGKSPGIPTGIADLDELTGGMRPGELWVTMGPTSTGKTVLMSQIALNVCGDGRKTAFFSCEMMVDEIIARAVANVGNANLTKVLNPTEWKKLDHSGKQHGERVVEAVREISIMNAWFDDTPRMTMSHIESECQRLADQNNGLDLIVVDYMQIVAPDSARRESREQEVARISGSLKQLAKRQACPVITGSQLNDDGRVRESRGIAFDSNVMLSIEDNGIRVVKNRNGQKDKEGDEPSLKLTLNGPLQKFTQ